MFQYKCTIFRKDKMPVLKPVTYNCYLQDSSVGDKIGIWCVHITNEMQLTQCSLLLSALNLFRAIFQPIIGSL